MQQDNSSSSKDFCAEETELIEASLKVLRNQLEQNTKDIERLRQLKEQALQNPSSYVKNLKTTVSRAPRPQKIYRIPEIDILRLATKIPKGSNPDKERRVEQLLEHLSYLQRKAVELNEPVTAQNVDLIERGASLSNNSSAIAASLAQVRSRNSSIDTFAVPKAQPKQTKRNTGNYNSWPSGSGHLILKKQQERRPPNPWTEEEHKRLVELLEKFPEESSQIERFTKISQALGTRSISQVASRVQKYFARLTQMKRRHPGSNRSSSATSKDPSLEITASSLNYDVSSSEGEDDDYTNLGVDPETAQNPEYREYLKLKKRFKRKEVSRAENGGRLAVHYGFKCDSCGLEPIVGTLWRCSQCPEEEEIDLCPQCIRSDFSKGSHTADHTMVKVEDEADEDYKDFVGEYRYLDPNFNP